MKREVLKFGYGDYIVDVDGIGIISDVQPTESGIGFNTLKNYSLLMRKPVMVFNHIEAALVEEACNANNKEASIIRTWKLTTTYGIQWGECGNISQSPLKQIKDEISSLNQIEKVRLISWVIDLSITEDW